MVVYQTVVGFIVVVLVYRHHGEGVGLFRWHIIQMKIAHQHNSIVIDRWTETTKVISYITEGITDRGFNNLTCNTIERCVILHLGTCLGDILFAIILHIIFFIINHVIIGIGDIYRLAPIWFDGDRGYAVRNVEVCSL